MPGDIAHLDQVLLRVFGIFRRGRKNTRWLSCAKASVGGKDSMAIAAMSVAARWIALRPVLIRYITVVSDRSMPQGTPTGSSLMTGAT
jgi:hypothetical protein